MYVVWIGFVLMYSYAFLCPCVDECENSGYFWRWYPLRWWCTFMIMLTGCSFPFAKRQRLLKEKYAFRSSYVAAAGLNIIVAKSTAFSNQAMLLIRHTLVALWYLYHFSLHELLLFCISFYLMCNAACKFEFPVQKVPFSSEGPLKDRRMHPST